MGVLTKCPIFNIRQVKDNKKDAGKRQEAAPIILFRFKASAERRQ